MFSWFKYKFITNPPAYQEALKYRKLEDTRLERDINRRIKETIKSGIFEMSLHDYEVELAKSRFVPRGFDIEEREEYIFPYLGICESCQKDLCDKQRKRKCYYLTWKK